MAAITRARMQLYLVFHREATQYGSDYSPKFLQETGVIMEICK